MMRRAALVLLFGLLPGILSAASPQTAFRPGAIWPDNNGVHINAHGGGILVHDGVFYWFGQHMVEGDAGNYAQVGVHVYSSKDLYNWNDAGIALRVSDDPQNDITKGCILERPKVIYNRQTSKFVMWFHLELKSQGYGAARSGVAVADQPTGPYRFIESIRPNAGHWPVNVPAELKQPLSAEEDAHVHKLHLGGGPVPNERRSFIQAALATVSTAGIAALGVAKEKESGPTDVPRLPIGFLGVGHSHAAGKIKAVQESADWELIGVCEEDERLQAEYATAGIPVLSREELLRRSQVVAVESLVQDHARDAKLALAAGKHVHLEKPPADTLNAFRELVTLAREKGVLLQMGYMWRYHPGINTALEAARQGWLGEVYMVRGTINTQLSAQQRAEVARYRGGTLFELGSHLIDVLARLLGRATNITSILKTHGPFEDHLADDTLAIFEFPKALGIISSSTLQPHAGRYRSLEILGTQGTAVVNPIEPPGLLIDLAKAAGSYQAGVNTVPLPQYVRYVPEFADLAAKIREGKKLTVSPEEDLLVQETLMRACEGRP